MLVGVQGECVGWFFAVVSMNSRCDSVHHDVFSDCLQLVVRAVLEIQERVQANLEMKTFFVEMVRYGGSWELGETCLR